MLWRRLKHSLRPHPPRADRWIKIKKCVSLEIMAKANDLLHHPRKADGVMLHKFVAFLAHHLVHRSRRAGWGEGDCFSL